MAADVTSLISRWLTLGAILLMTGARVFEWWVLPALDLGQATDRGSQVVERARRLSRYALAGLAIAMSVRLWLQAASFTDPGASVLPMISTVLTGMTWGRGWIAQALLVLICALPFRRTASILVAAALSATPALMGHAIGTEGLTVVAVLADWVHVFAAGAWLGALMVLAVAALPVVDAAGALRLVTRFSPIALSSAAVIAATGSVSAWLHLPGWSALVTEPYGRWLVLKVVLVGVVALLGRHNWKRSTPALAAGDKQMLVRFGRFEVLVTVLILLVTSILIATPFPGEG